MRLIDLSHHIANGMPVYPGDDPPILEQTASVAQNGLAQYKLISSMHAGTHIDAPFHMVGGGKKISEFSPENFIGRGAVVDARGKAEISADLLSGKNIGSGDIVIVVTGWYEKFGTPEYFSSFPLVTKGFAERLVELKVKMLGLDTPSPDATPPYREHQTLLGNGILIIENLNNTEGLLEARQLEILALPLNIDADASLARVIARINE